MDKYAWGVLSKMNNDASDVMDDYKNGLKERLELEREYCLLSNRFEDLSDEEHLRFQALEEEYNVDYEKRFIDKILEQIEGDEDCNYNDIVIQLALIAFANSTYHIPIYEKTLEVAYKEWENIEQWDEEVREDRRDFLATVNTLAKLHLKVSKGWYKLEDGSIDLVRGNE